MHTAVRKNIRFPLLR